MSKASKIISLFESFHFPDQETKDWFYDEIEDPIHWVDFHQYGEEDFYHREALETAFEEIKSKTYEIGYRFISQYFNKSPRYLDLIFTAFVDLSFFTAIPEFFRLSRLNKYGNPESGVFHELTNSGMSHLNISEREARELIDLAKNTPYFNQMVDAYSELYTGYSNIMSDLEIERRYGDHSPRSIFDYDDDY